MHLNVTTLELIFLIAATLIGMSVQATFGFGFAFFVAPVAVAVMAGKEAVTLLLLMGVLINGMIVVAGPQKIAIRMDLIRPVIIAAVPGMIIGIFLLLSVSKAFLQISVGVILVLAAIQRKMSLHKSGTAEEDRPTRENSTTIGLTVGLVSGILNTATSLNGPTLALWFSRLIDDAVEIRDTIAAALLFFNVIGVLGIMIFAGKIFTSDLLNLFLVISPFVVVSYFIGTKRFKEIANVDAYDTFILTLVALIGVGCVLMAAGSVVS